MTTPRTQRVVAVIGTRPEAIKLAPLCLAMAASDDFELVLVATGQHRTMLDQVLGHFELSPDFDLDVSSPGQTLTQVTTRVLEGLEPVLIEACPDAVLVQGDTTSAFAGALASYYQRCPVVHLEAGLRTGDIYSPYPEEMNRMLCGALSSLHLAPTPKARGHLLAENVDAASICVTGNTVIDALLWTVDRDPSLPDATAIAGHDGPVLLVTAHRRESWGAPMREVGRALRTLADQRAELLIVLPLHLNPTVRDALLPAVEGASNIEVIEPLEYPSFVACLNRATLLLTDSGGVQEEGPALAKPVLVMRDTTERPEGITAGTARLVGTDHDRIVTEVGRLLDDPSAYEAMAQAQNPYGDGKASARSLDAMRRLFGQDVAIDEFDPGREP